MEQYSFFATCPRYLETMLYDEIASMGAEKVEETQSGVRFDGSLSVGYRVCLWSHLASRVFLALDSFQVHNSEEMYGNVVDFPWEHHFTTGHTFAVSAVINNSCFNHSNYAALTVKDAIVDRFRKNSGKRPSIDPETPDILIRVHVNKTDCLMYLDLSGESLHKRGYRVVSTEAPLRENTAAALLIRSGWPRLAAEGKCFMDPMCGSGTLLIEAMMMAADIAPGLLRDHYGFLSWKKHDAESWQSLINEAKKRKEAGLQNPPLIFGSDCDRAALASCQANIEAAGLQGMIGIKHYRFEEIPTTDLEKLSGLMVTNPPYGVRIGNSDGIEKLYDSLGRWMVENLQGWQAGVITSEKELARHTGLRALKVNTFYNGNIKCAFATFILDEKNRYREYKKNGTV
jgi:23S rRNA (guanine2445-N2)-methyltransferase / 23S rRNA (guanine2069-N7)-methyltransferase